MVTEFSGLSILQDKRQNQKKIISLGLPQGSPNICDHKINIMKTNIRSYIFLFCLAFLYPGAVNSQMIVPGSEAFLDKLRLNDGLKTITRGTYDAISGDPFLFKDFHEGELTLENGENCRLNMRYDIYGDQVHLENDGNIFGIIHPEKVALITIDTLRFVYCNYSRSPSGKPSDKGAYFILENEGKCKLLIRKNIRIQEAEPPRPYQDAKPARFINTSDTYYFKTGDDNAILVRNKNDVLSVLSDKKEAVKNFMNSSNLNVNKIEDLKRIASYYNNL